MRLLGVDSTLATFRWDLLYLLAQLSSDERPGVADLAAPIESAVNAVEARRAALEQSQAAVVIASAMMAKRDKKRDRVITKMGGVARATEREIYERFFPKLNPSQTAKLGIDAESVEVARILGEMKTLDTTHPLRLAYEANLTSTQEALALTKKSADEAEVNLTLERSQVARSKQEWDKLRLETHGKLVALLADKGEADAFFRPAANVPGEKNDAPEEPAGG